MDLHVWSISTDISGEQRAQLESLLSPSEKKRAGAYRADIDRRRFVAGRGFLRQVLAHHCDSDPAELGIVGERHSKPGLTLPRGPHPWRFSFSRTGELAVCVVSEGRDVGIDVEAVVDIEGIEHVAATAFGPDELSYWRSLAPHRRRAGFYRLWTRKEALGKAAGRGMRPGPETIEVPTGALEPGRSHVVDGWVMSDLAPGEGTVGSLVVESSGGSHYTDGDPAGAPSVPGAQKIVRSYPG